MSAVFLPFPELLNLRKEKTDINEKPPAHELPKTWLETVTVDKEPLGWPEWLGEDPPPTPRDGRTPRGEIRTTAAKRAEVVIPLGVVGGAGLEAVRLRLLAWRDRREHEVTATLEIEGGRRFVCLARVDAWPPDPHDNARRDICRRLGILPTVDSHHVHRFQDNAILGFDGFAPLGNLPIARPIEGGNLSFRRFMEIVCLEFRVKGLEEFPPPPNWGSLI